MWGIMGSVEFDFGFGISDFGFRELLLVDMIVGPHKEADGDISRISDFVK